MSAVVRELYHFIFDPHSRLVRLALGEKKLEFHEISVRYWEANETFLKLNPSGFLPVLVETPQGDSGGQSHRVCETRAILDFLDEQYPDVKLWPENINERAEARRLVGWLERKFDFEVNALLLHEKMEKRLMGLGAPNIAAMRQGREAMKDHLKMFDTLLGHRSWVAGKDMSFADFALAGQLSLHDYFDEINWSRYTSLKTWYMAIKSRPCFRPLLADRLAGFVPSAHYAELDF